MEEAEMLRYVLLQSCRTYWKGGIPKFIRKVTGWLNLAGTAFYSVVVW